MGWWKNRRAYLDDFQKDVRGDWIYTGKTYSWQSNRKKVLPVLVGSAAVGFAAGVVGGCIPNVGMTGRAWVLLPYVVALVASFTVLWALGRLAGAGDPVREYEFTATVGKLPHRIILTLIFSGLAVVAEIVNVFIPGFVGTIPFTLLFILLELVSFGTVFWIRRIMAGLRWGGLEEPESPQEPDTQDLSE